MKVKLLSLVFLCVCAFAKAQVGIGTTTPEGALDVVSSNAGMVIPRVSDIDSVTTPDGNPPVDGTIVYDLSLERLCMRIAGFWVCTDVTAVTTTDPNSEEFSTIANYIKASNTDAFDIFGEAVSISADGNYLAIGASREDSNATGINGNQADNSASSSGAVYIFVRSGSTWVQEAYIKASNTDAGDSFGSTVSLDSDGSRLAVSAIGEDSNATGINGNQADNSANTSGAVYVFVRSGSTWSQEAYIKASNTDAFDFFGETVSISADGNYLAIGADSERSNATGINGNQANNSQTNAGAVYIFVRSGSTWTQEAYIKASNTAFGDSFGGDVSLNVDGSTLVVSAIGEDSNATGINGNQADNSANNSGAVYVFVRSGSTWSQETYIKASNTDALDIFGTSVSLSGDGNLLAVAAIFEDSNAVGVNGDETDNSANTSGAVYVFVRSGSTWSQEAYIKATNTGAGDEFGTSIALNLDGTRLVVGAISERSSATGINGDQTNNALADAGAVYSYVRAGITWTPDGYIKASNTGSRDEFGTSVALSADGSRLVVSAQDEESNATGVGGDQTNNTAGDAGAVYIVE